MIFHKMNRWNFFIFSSARKLQLQVNQNVENWLLTRAIELMGVRRGKHFPTWRYSFFPSHESALLITTLAFLSYFYVYSCSYITRELLFPHYSNTAFKVEVEWSGWWGWLAGWQKYLWLFIPSSSFSIRLRITDVGTGIFSSSSSLVSLLSAFLLSFVFRHKHTYPPVLFDVTATCCSHFLCSVCFSPQLKNAIINNYTEAFLGRFKCVYLLLYLMKAPTR